MKLRYNLSSLDYNMYKKITATTFMDDTTTELDAVMLFDELTELHSCDILHIKTNCNNVKLIQKLEKHGCIFTGCLVKYSKCVTELQDAKGTDYTLLKDTFTKEHLASVAKAAFEGYFGHYNYDALYKDELVQDMYANWAINLYKNYDTTTIIIKGNGVIKGFIALEHNGIQLQCTLAFTNKDYGKIGIFTSLLKLVNNYAMQNGYKSIVYSTQVNNLYVQKALVKNGYSPIEYTYTLHKHLK